MTVTISGGRTAHHVGVITANRVRVGDTVRVWSSCGPDYRMVLGINQTAKETGITTFDKYPIVGPARNVTRFYPNGDYVEIVL